MDPGPEIQEVSLTGSGTLPAAWKAIKAANNHSGFEHWIPACCKENPVFVERKAFSNLTGCRVNRDPYLYLGVIFYVTDVSLLEDEVKLLPPPFFYQYPRPLFR